VSREDVEVVRRLYEGFAQGKLWDAAPLLDQDIVLRRFGGQPGVWRGLDAFTAGIVEYIEAFDNLRIEGEEFVDLGGGRVLVYARHRGTGRDSGLPFDQELGDVLTLREGRIVTWMAYWDRADALEAVGLRE
jgi:ketosteroid isomerase-like protein